MNLTDLRQKIALGTVQLGLTYGINNTSGKPDEAEAHRILDKAVVSNITLLDSAEAYGNSLDVIGAYLRKNKKSGLRLIDKFIGDGSSLSARVANTLSSTGCDRLYALMYHRFSDYKSGRYKAELSDLRSDGMIGKIGISLYHPEELEMTIDDDDISVIQIPFHPWDASSEKKLLLQEARSAGKEIHVRSVFFQGLFFKNASDLTGNLRSFVPALTQFRSIVERNGKTVREACLNYALHQPFIDRVVIGVETARQLEENINAIMEDCPSWIMNDLEAEIAEKKILNPSHWEP